MTVDTPLQADFLPPDGADMLVNDAERTLRRIQRLAPELFSGERLTMRGQFAVLHVILDALEESLTVRRAWKPRRERLVYRSIQPKALRHSA